MRAALCMVFVLGVCATAAAADDPIARGKKLFVDQKCTDCHAIAGNGNTQSPLDSIGNRLTPDVIREWITDPKGAAKKTASTFRPHRKITMKEYSLPKADVDALVAYLSSLKGR